MAENVCPKLEKCPIFIKGVLFSEMAGEAYKNLYCLKDNKYSQCKRFMVSQKMVCRIPEKILPNSVLSVDEIIEKIEKLKIKI